MLVRKAPGFVIIDLRQDVMVSRIGKPLDAFSMIALELEFIRLEFLVFLLQNWPVRTGQ